MCNMNDNRRNSRWKQNIGDNRSAARHGPTPHGDKLLYKQFELLLQWRLVSLWFITRKLDIFDKSLFIEENFAKRD